MTVSSLFWLTHGPVLLAVVIAMAADMAGTPRAGRLGPAALLLAAGSLALVGGHVLEADGYAGSLSAGGHISSIGGVVLVLTAASIFGSSGSRTTTDAALASMAALTASLAVASTDAVAMLVSLEASALCSYALVATAGTRQAQESAMKYFVQGAVATGLLVLGTAALIPSAGDLAFRSISELSSVSGPVAGTLTLGIVAIAASLSFKSGAAPFHSWTPDAYEQASPPAASVLSGPVKVAMLAVLSTFVASVVTAGVTQTAPFGIVGGDLIAVLGVMALLSVAVGSTVALTTASYTRMLAYAGVAQVGYALVALAAMGPSAAVTFAVTYGVASTGAFLAAEAFRRHRPDWDGRIQSLSGLGAEAPRTSAAVTVILMSLAGIPPIFGFWGKFQAFGAAIGASAAYAQADMRSMSVWLASLAAAGIAGSIISLGYYGSVIKSLYFGQAETSLTSSGGGSSFSGRSRGGQASLTVVAIALGLVILGLLPLALGVASAFSGFLLR